MPDHAVQPGIIIWVFKDALLQDTTQYQAKFSFFILLCKIQV